MYLGWRQFHKLKPQETLTEELYNNFPVFKNYHPFSELNEFEKFIIYCEYVQQNNKDASFEQQALKFRRPVAVSRVQGNVKTFKIGGYDVLVGFYVTSTKEDMRISVKTPLFDITISSFVTKGGFIPFCSVDPIYHNSGFTVSVIVTIETPEDIKLEIEGVYCHALTRTVFVDQDYLSALTDVTSDYWCKFPKPKTHFEYPKKIKLNKGLIDLKPIIIPDLESSLIKYLDKIYLIFTPNQCDKEKVTENLYICQEKPTGYMCYSYTDIPWKCTLVYFEQSGLVEDLSPHSVVMGKGDGSGMLFGYVVE
jgi:hypothetical protein